MRAASPADDVELLRFATAGSVDDGKSTLIGRLLHDTKTVYEDQLAHITDVSARRGDARVNLALLTDGLRAEREQGITIDVAYRAFATPRRRFILADTPGHVEYTRNMVTGASTAGLMVILVDARHGLVEQTRRHALVAALLRVPHLVVAVNKMDLVGWAEPVFRRIEADVRAFAARLDLIGDLTVLPISALTGAHVVTPSAEMPWFAGPPLLAHLETVDLARAGDRGDARFPVQWIVQPSGYAGQVAGGVLRAGDAVVVLPSGATTTIARIEQGGEAIAEASAPMSVTLHLTDAVDVGRGDLLCRPDRPPTVGQELDAMVCWLGDRPLAVTGHYALKHTTRWTRGVVGAVLDRIDVATGERAAAAGTLGPNDVGRVRLRTSTPLVYDAYRHNRTTGSFILVDEATNATVAAGMLLEARA